MPVRNYISTFFLFAVVLSGCTSSAKAPVSSRGTAPEPRAKIITPPGATKPQRHAAAASSYVVQRSDTLYSIAWQRGLEVQELASINAMHPPYTIYTGQRLQVTSSSQVPQAAPLARTAPIRATPLPKSVPVPAPPAPSQQSVPVPAPPAPSQPAPAPAAARIAEAPAYDGNWVWPSRGTLLRAYQGHGNGKKGIDISGHHGQPVNAAAGGKVVYVGSGLVGYGRLIIIKHNESLLSAYGHNSKLLVAEGDHVKAGQLIAKMGSSGTNRTALYFEIRKDGKPVNPTTYLPKK